MISIEDVQDHMRDILVEWGRGWEVLNKRSCKIICTDPDVGRGIAEFAVIPVDACGFLKNDEAQTFVVTVAVKEVKED